MLLRLQNAPGYGIAHQFVKTQALSATVNEPPGLRVSQHPVARATVTQASPAPRTDIPSYSQAADGLHGSIFVSADAPVYDVPLSVIHRPLQSTTNCQKVLTD